MSPVKKRKMIKERGTKVPFSIKSIKATYMKGKLIASAKPNEHRVRVRNKIFVYGRIRKRILTEEQCYIHLMRQAAKVVLRRVREYCGYKPPTV